MTSIQQSKPRQMAVLMGLETPRLIEAKIAKMFLPLSWDEDLNRCAMLFALDDGATINIKQNQNKEVFVSVDGKTIYVDYLLREMILDIINPILRQLRTQIHGPLKDTEIWMSIGLPGVTKIKIHKHKYPHHLSTDDTIWYGAKHKMSKDGGANHYVHGHIKSLKKTT